MKSAVPVYLICSILAATCSPRQAGEYHFQRPALVDDGLEVGSPSEVGLDPRPIAGAVTDIRQGRYGEIHSLLIFRDGRLAVEEYFPGHDYLWDGPDFHGAMVNWDRNTSHNVHSAGKSITSACVGIAIDMGYIEGVNQPIFRYLPDHQPLRTPEKSRITIEHLLTMTSGLEWDEWGSTYSDEENDVIALWMSCDDPVACILEKPLVSEPGASFTYSGGNMILLGEIVKNATGMAIDAFSSKYLFGPMGIDAPSWRWIEGTGVVYAGGDQRLTPREMLKFGVTFLSRGVWNGRQVVPEEWVGRSATPYPGPDNTWFNHPLRPIPPGDGTRGRRGYAYGWWTHEFSRMGRMYPAFWAFGWGGQRIVVFPDQNAVVVFTGANYTTADPTTRILSRHIIPAFE